MSAHDPLITLRQMADFIKEAQGLASGKSLDALQIQFPHLLSTVERMISDLED